MLPKRVEAVGTTLSCSPVRSNQLLRLACRHCRTPLDLLQPQGDRPDQLLATCAGCGGWFRVEFRANDPRGVMMDLPEVPPLMLPAAANPAMAQVV